MASKDTKLNIIIDAQNKTSSGFASLKRQLDITKTSVEGVSSAMKLIGTGGVVALTGLTAFLKSSVDSYAETQLAMAKMDATLRTMGKTADGAREKILDASSAVVRLGFDDEAAAVSITKLFQVTGDLNKAMDLNSLAMDLARAKSIGLDEASRMVTLVLAGNARALKEYGIQLDETKTPAEALVQLQGMVAGQAEEATKSIAVQGQVLQETYANLLDTLAETFVPILNEALKAVTPMIERTTEWIKANPELTRTLLTTAIAITGVMAVMLPLGLALPGIVATFGLLTGAISAFFAAMGFLFSPLGLLTALIVGVGFAAFTLSNQWQDAWDLITIVVGESANVIQSIVEGIVNFVIDNINWLIKKINSVLDSLASLPVVGKKFSGLSIDTLDPFTMERYDTGAVYNEMMARPKAKTAGDTIVNITGNNFLDKMGAQQIGDSIMSQLKMSNAL